MGGQFRDGHLSGKPLSAPEVEPNGSLSRNRPTDEPLHNSSSSNEAQPVNDSSTAPAGSGQPEPVNFVAFGSENAAFDGGDKVSVDSALVADASSGKSDVEFSAAISNGDVSETVSEDEAEVEKGLAQIDPLTVRPRVSSCVLAVVLALICLAAAAGVYWFGVHTLQGQNFDEIVWQNLEGAVPSWIVVVSRALSYRATIPIISLLIALLALVVVVVRKRWWLLGQVAVFGIVAYGASWLKRLLPRPMITRIASSHSNTAPSGHALLAIACVLALLVVVPRVWRALVAVLGGAYGILAAVSLVVCRWHRPSDVLMSLLIGGGLMMLALAFTRKSGMDSPGSRMSSASIQIVGSIMITFGVVSCVYAGYMFWQIYPGLGMMAMWAKNCACALTMAAIIGVGCLISGLTLAVRQLTASPLTRLGLVGAPPAPPSE